MHNNISLQIYELRDINIKRIYIILILFIHSYSFYDKNKFYKCLQSTEIFFIIFKQVEKNKQNVNRNKTNIFH